MKKREKRKPILSVTAKDCRWDYFRASGAGGQKRNKTSSAVRCTHKDSRAVGQCTEFRSQRKNKEMAFKKMAESKKFKLWCKVEVSRKLGREEEIQQEVERAMRHSNLKIEVKDDKGRWVKSDVDTKVE